MPESKGSSGRAVAVLGSSGSVGRAAIDAARALGYDVAALAGGSDLTLLVRQVADLKPQMVCVRRRKDMEELSGRMSEIPEVRRSATPEVVWGDEGLERVATHEAVSTAVMALPSGAGIAAALSVVKTGRKLALATKEIAVSAGALLRHHCSDDGGVCVPVDSELSALHQMLQVHPRESLDRVVLCASGGPFYGLDPVELEHVTPDEALAHPVWRMGPKVTVDSATMMNKGLEIMAACLLMGIPRDRLDAVVHPQCRVHAMVELHDGTFRAHLAPAEMQWALGYALAFPDPPANRLGTLEPAELGNLEFAPIDRAAFPCFSLAEQALRSGGSTPCALSAADEVAVQAFLDGRLTFPEIARCLEAVVESAEQKGLNSAEPDSLENVMAADGWARQRASEWVAGAQ